MGERQGLKSHRLPQVFEWIWTILKYSAAWRLWCLQYWYWIYWRFWGRNTSSLCYRMQSHINLVLLTNMPRNDARWLQQPCLFLIFREAFQNPPLLNKKMKQLLILENTKISTKYQWYLHKNYLILISQQHSICYGCLWEKKTNVEHWYFCETACTNTTATEQWELMYCSNDFFVHVSILKKKETSLE